MSEEAVARSEKWASLDPGRSTLPDFLRYLAAGNRLEAMNIVDQLDDTQSYTKALYALLEEKDQTIEWFQKGLDENQYMVLFNVYPPFAPLRNEPRFTDPDVADEFGTLTNQRDISSWAERSGDGPVTGFTLVPRPLP